MGGSRKTGEERERWGVDTREEALQCEGEKKDSQRNKG